MAGTENLLETRLKSLISSIATSEKKFKSLNSAIDNATKKANEYLSKTDDLIENLIQEGDYNSRQEEKARETLQRFINKTKNEQGRTLTQILEDLEEKNEKLAGEQETLNQIKSERDSIKNELKDIRSTLYNTQTAIAGLLTTVKQSPYFDKKTGNLVQNYYTSALKEFGKKQRTKDTAIGRILSLYDAGKAGGIKGIGSALLGQSLTSMLKSDKGLVNGLGQILTLGRIGYHNRKENKLQESMVNERLYKGRKLTEEELNEAYKQIQNNIILQQHKEGRQLTGEEKQKIREETLRQYRTERGLFEKHKSEEEIRKEVADDRRLISTSTQMAARNGSWIANPQQDKNGNITGLEDVSISIERFNNVIYRSSSDILDFFGGAEKELEKIALLGSKDKRDEQNETIAILTERNKELTAEYENQEKTISKTKGEVIKFNTEFENMYKIIEKAYGSYDAMMETLKNKGASNNEIDNVRSQSIEDEKKRKTQQEAQGLQKPKEFASGGVVTEPVRGLVGEAGPEAIVPIKKNPLKEFFGGIASAFAPQAETSEEFERRQKTDESVQSLPEKLETIIELLTGEAKERKKKEKPSWLKKLLMFLMPLKLLGNIRQFIQRLPMMILKNALRHIVIPLGEIIGRKLMGAIKWFMGTGAGQFIGRIVSRFTKPITNLFAKFASTKVGAALLGLGGQGFNKAKNATKRWLGYEVEEDVELPDKKDGKKGKKGKKGKAFKAGRNIGKAGKGIFKMAGRALGPLASGAMALWDAVDGYNDTDLHKRMFNLKEGEEASTMQKLGASVASGLSGATFGLVSPETIGKIGGAATDMIKGMFSDVTEEFGKGNYIKGTLKALNKFNPLNWVSKGFGMIWNQFGKEFPDIKKWIDDHNPFKWLGKKFDEICNWFKNFSFTDFLFGSVEKEKEKFEKEVIDYARKHNMSVESAREQLRQQSGLQLVEQFADGGIVTEPTKGLVGEAGPEAIVPLDDFYQKQDSMEVNRIIREGEESKKMDDRFEPIIEMAKKALDFFKDTSEKLKEQKEELKKLTEDSTKNKQGLGGTPGAPSAPGDTSTPSRPGEQHPTFDNSGLNLNYNGSNTGLANSDAIVQNADWKFAGKGGNSGGRVTQEVKDSIMAAAKEYGINPALMASMANSEAGLRANAINQEKPGDPDSAMGLFQFIGSTRRGIMKQNPEMFKNGANWLDPRLNARIAAMQMKKNAAMLQRHGHDVNAANMYAMWHIGPAAAKLLDEAKKNPNASAEEIIKKVQGEKHWNTMMKYESNRRLVQGKTLEQYFAGMGQKMKDNEVMVGDWSLSGNGTAGASTMQQMPSSSNQGGIVQERPQSSSGATGGGNALYNMAKSFLGVRYGMEQGKSRSGYNQAAYTRFNPNLKKDANGNWIAGSKAGIFGGAGTMDCSQFVSTVMSNLGYGNYVNKSGGAYNAESIRQDLRRKGYKPKASINQLQEGDVLFTLGSIHAGKGKAGHVAIAVRNPNTGELEIAESVGDKSYSGVQIKPISGQWKAGNVEIYGSPANSIQQEPNANGASSAIQDNPGQGTQPGQPSMQSQLADTTASQNPVMNSGAIQNTAQAAMNAQTSAYYASGGANTGNVNVTNVNNSSSNGMGNKPVFATVNDPMGWATLQGNAVH